MPRLYRRGVHSGSLGEATGTDPRPWLHQVVPVRAEPPALPGMGHVKPFEGHGPLPKKPHPALPFLPHSRFA